MPVQAPRLLQTSGRKRSELKESSWWCAWLCSFSIELLYLRFISPFSSICREDSRGSTRGSLGTRPACTSRTARRLERYRSRCSEASHRPAQPFSRRCSESGFHTHRSEWGHEECQLAPPCEALLRGAQCSRRLLQSIRGRASAEALLHRSPQSSMRGPA